jgi:hypothetical protein
MTNCPDGWATDQVLMHGEPLDRCDASVTAMISVFAVTTCLQLFVALGQTHLWIGRERRKRLKNVDARNKKTFICGVKLPLVPALSWLAAVLFLLFAVLALLNIANTSNGAPTFFIGMIMVCYAIIALLLFLKFVSLGHNVIGAGGGKWAAQQLAAEQQSKLTKFDQTGRVIMFLAFAALLGCFLSFCVFGLIFPNK